MWGTMLNIPFIASAARPFFFPFARELILGWVYDYDFAKQKSEAKPNFQKAHITDLFKGRVRLESQLHGSPRQPHPHAGARSPAAHQRPCASVPGAAPLGQMGPGPVAAHPGSGPLHHRQHGGWPWGAGAASTVRPAAATPLRVFVVGRG